ncbi:MAG: hypothetical protein GX969_03345 [Firmicutes bacterium]|nr:hypothetical protein [Bacillota bacterium]
MNEMDYEVDILEIIRILMRKKWQIIAVILICAVTAYIVSSNMTKIYKATSVIMIKQDPQVRSIPFLQDAIASPLGNMKNYLEYLKSRTITEATLNRLGWLQSSPKETIRAWQERLSVEQIQGTDLAKLSIEHDNQEEATVFINTLIEEFQRRVKEMNQESTWAALNFTTQQLAIAEQNLKEAEEALLKYKEAHGIIEPSAEIKACIDRFISIEQNIFQTEMELKATESEQQKLTEILQDVDPTLITTTTLVNNPVAQQYRTQLSRLEADLTAALEQYTENHPFIITLKNQIDHISHKLVEEAERITGSETTSLNPTYQDLRSKLISGQAVMVGLEAKLEALENNRSQAEAELSSIPKKEIDFARLVRNQRANEEIYVMLHTKYEEMKIWGAIEVSDIHVIDKAILPEKPIKPRKLLNTTIAGILGMFIAVGYILLIEYTDTTIKSLKEAEQVLGLPVVGLIPNLVKSHRQKRTSEYIKSQRARLNLP